MDISVIWVKKLWARYKHIEPDQITYPRPMGRSKKSLPSRQEHSTVLSAYHNSNLATTCLKDEIKDVTGMDISYDTIYYILRDEGLSERQPKKSRWRKWIRYERKLSKEL